MAQQSGYSEIINGDIVLKHWDNITIVKEVYNKMRDLATNGNFLGKGVVAELVKHTDATLIQNKQNLFLKNLYFKIFDIIVEQGQVVDALNMLFDSVQDLMNGKVPVEELFTTCRYTPGVGAIDIFVENLLKEGQVINPGDILTFIVVIDSNNQAIGHRMKSIEQYNSLSCKIDYMHIIKNILQSPINKLFDIAYGQQLSQMTDIYYRPSIRKHPIYLSTPMTFLVGALKNGVDVSTIKKEIFLKMLHRVD